jgi:sugar/nucleoside kinase (ribokinase family)
VTYDLALMGTTCTAAGAGDAFIGGVICGIVQQLPVLSLLTLATYVAAQKLKAPGARRGIPSREQVEAALPGLLPQL